MDVKQKLIDANELLKSIRDDYNINGAHFAMIRRHIKEATAVDAVEVVHGLWIKTKEPLGYDDVDCVECSNCHESWIADEDTGFDYLELWNYCPNCGAKMDGGAD